MNRNKKVILINGATSNIGKATALLFAENNDKLVLVDNKERSLNELVENIKQNTEEIINIDSHIKDKHDIEKVINKTIETYSRIDVIVNIFEMYYEGNVFIENPVEIYDKIKSYNIDPIDKITQTVLPHLKNTKGCIINISNVICNDTSGYKTVYNISKAALTHYTKSSALDLASKGVRIYAIHSGPVWGKLSEDGNIDNDNNDKIYYEIEPDNIAIIIRHIASNRYGFLRRETSIIEAGSSI